MEKLGQMVTNSEGISRIRRCLLRRFNNFEVFRELPITCKYLKVRGSNKELGLELGLENSRS